MWGTSTPGACRSDPRSPVDRSGVPWTGCPARMRLFDERPRPCAGAFGQEARGLNAWCVHGGWQRFADGAWGIRGRGTFRACLAACHLPPRSTPPMTGIHTMPGAARLLTVAAALLLSGAALAGQPLFVGEARPGADGARTAQRLAAKPDSAGVRVVQANPRVVAADTGEIELELGGRRLNLVLEGARATSGGSLV